jgi:hypothetical protein
MGTTPIYELPFPEPTDPADVPADIEALATPVETVIAAVDARVDTLEATATTRPPIVTALPGSPVTGQEIYFQPDPGTQPWLFWHLRYNGGSASAYKWEAVGSQLALSTIDPTSRALAGATTYAVGPTELSIAVPLGGEYFCEAKADISSATAVLKLIKVSTAIGGADDTWAQGHALAPVVPLTATTPRLDIAAGGKAILLYRQGTGEAGQWQRRSLHIRPVRVG